nr:MAG TPA: Zn2+ transporter ZntB-like subfamily protein [Crassvirales sp.]
MFCNANYYPCTGYLSFNGREMKKILLIASPFFIIYLIAAFICWDIEWIISGWEWRVWYIIACSTISLAVCVDLKA